MSTVEEHYARHLAPVYLWMAGGAEAALQAGAAEIEALQLPLAPGAAVVDLGAGFGMHTIALARQGARVTAIDSSPELLRTLADLGRGLPIRTIEGDLLAFRQHLKEAPSAILCMGDTLTHLPTRDNVESLMQSAAAALAPGGVLVLTFRDYTVPLEGDQRFIPVRSDEDRILTCFLEYEPDAVVVHDILHRRTQQGWETRVSHYRKLRLAPDRLVDAMQSHGLEVRRESGMRGMVRLVALRKP
jgi:SAM-dependent methyltransferase